MKNMKNIATNKADNLVKAYFSRYISTSKPYLLEIDFQERFPCIKVAELDSGNSWAPSSSMNVVPELQQEFKELLIKDGLVERNNNIINLTPHSIELPGLSIPTSGVVEMKEELLGSFNGVDLYTTSYKDVTGLPAPKEGVLLIVSDIVRSACPDRTDLASPQGLRRDEDGKVIGCNGLSVHPENIEILTQLARMESWSNTTHQTSSNSGRAFDTRSNGVQRGLGETITGKSHNLAGQMAMDSLQSKIEDANNQKEGALEALGSTLPLFMRGSSPSGTHEDPFFNGFWDKERFGDIGTSLEASIKTLLQKEEVRSAFQRSAKFDFERIVDKLNK